MWANIAIAVAKWVAVMVASYLISMALTPKSKSNTPDAAAADDWEFPQADEGTPQCIFFGDCWTADWQVLDYGNYRYTEIKK
jgi:hypothetical protein